MIYSIYHIYYLYVTNITYTPFIYRNHVHYMMPSDKIINFKQDIQTRTWTHIEK